MKQLRIILSVILTGIGVALTYHLFENAVHGSINLIWNTSLDTASNRLLVLPVCTILTCVYFGAQHVLDKKAEDRESQGLGNMPEPTIHSFIKILVIGFLSLVAGASLGPEAVLVPACMVLGTLVGSKLLKNEEKLINLVAAASIMALFTAFFHSFLVGLLSLALVLKQANTKFKPQLLVIAALASGSSILTLNLVSAEAYAPLPAYSWTPNTETVFLSFVLVALGFLIVLGMEKLHVLFEKAKQQIAKKGWLIHGFVAGAVLSILYLLGGTLVEFTGNQSILPLLEKTPAMSLAALAWVLLTKVIAINWSKALGYRGGMIFPIIFVAAVLVAMVQKYETDYNLIYGLIAVLIGAFAANKKTHTLV